MEYSDWGAHGSDTSGAVSVLHSADDLLDVKPLSIFDRPLPTGEIIITDSSDFDSSGTEDEKPDINKIRKTWTALEPGNDEKILSELAKDKVQIQELENDEKAFSKRGNDEMVLSEQGNNERVLSEHENDEKVPLEHGNYETIFSEAGNKGKILSEPGIRGLTLTDSINSGKILAEARNSGKILSEPGKAVLIARSKNRTILIKRSKLQKIPDPEVENADEVHSKCIVAQTVAPDGKTKVRIMRGNIVENISDTGFMSFDASKSVGFSNVLKRKVGPSSESQDVQSDVRSEPDPQSKSLHLVYTVTTDGEQIECRQRFQDAPEADLALTRMDHSYCREDGKCSRTSPVFPNETIKQQNLQVREPAIKAKPKLISKSRFVKESHPILEGKTVKTEKKFKITNKSSLIDGTRLVKMDERVTEEDRTVKPEDKMKTVNFSHHTLVEDQIIEVETQKPEVKVKMFDLSRLRKPRPVKDKTLQPESNLKLVDLANLVKVDNLEIDKAKAVQTENIKLVKLSNHIKVKDCLTEKVTPEVKNLIKVKDCITEKVTPEGTKHRYIKRIMRRNDRAEASSSDDINALPFRPDAVDETTLNAEGCIPNLLFLSEVEESVPNLVKSQSPIRNKISRAVKTSAESRIKFGHGKKHKSQCKKPVRRSIEENDWLQVNSVMKTYKKGSSLTEADLTGDLTLLEKVEEMAKGIYNQEFREDTDSEGRPTPEREIDCTVDKTQGSLVIEELIAESASKELTKVQRVIDQEFREVEKVVMLPSAPDGVSTQIRQKTTVKSPKKRKPKVLKSLEAEHSAGKDKKRRRKRKHKTVCHCPGCDSGNSAVRRKTCHFQDQLTKECYVPLPTLADSGYTYDQRKHCYLPSRPQFKS